MIGGEKVHGHVGWDFYYNAVFDVWLLDKTFNSFFSTHKT